MGIATPSARILRRRTSPVFTAFCDGAFALSMAAALLPNHPWAGMVAAVLATLPEWLNLARRRRSAEMSFAPDPLTPDFPAFSKAFLESAAKCATEGAIQKWTLCPYCEKGGEFVVYSLDFRPAKAELSIGVEPHFNRVKTDIVFRPRLPLPVEVRDVPVTLVLSPAETPRQVFLDADRRFAMPWNRRGGNWLRDDVAKLWPALALAAYAAFPNSMAVTPERLAAIALLLVFATFACARRRPKAANGNALFFSTEQLSKFKRKQGCARREKTLQFRTSKGMGPDDEFVDVADEGVAVAAGAILPDEERHA